MLGRGCVDRCSIDAAICFIAFAVRVSFSASANAVVDLLNADISCRMYHELRRSSLLLSGSTATVENSLKRNDFPHLGFFFSRLDDAVELNIPDDEEEADNIISDAFLLMPP